MIWGVPEAWRQCFSSSMNSGKIVAGGRTGGRTDGWTGIEGSIRGPRGPKNSGCARRCQHFHMVRKMGSDGRELFRARTSVAEACLWWQPDGESRRASPPVAASLTASSVAHTERERLRERLWDSGTHWEGIVESLRHCWEREASLPKDAVKENLTLTNSQYLHEEVTRNHWRRKLKQVIFKSDSV